MIDETGPVVVSDDWSLEKDPASTGQVSARQALMTLPPDQRAAVVIVDMEGYSVADAAALLGVPTGTVKSRCARGRLKLSTQLAYLKDAGNRI